MKVHGVFHNVFRRSVNVIHLAASLSVALMLLTLPVPRVYQPADHFRSPEIRRSIERSVSLERTTNDTSESISASYLEPTGFFRANDEARLTPSTEYTFVPQIRLSRLLLRRNAGSSRSGIPDPLL